MFVQTVLNVDFGSYVSTYWNVDFVVLQQLKWSAQ